MEIFPRRIAVFQLALTFNDKIRVLPSMRPIASSDGSGFAIKILKGTLLSLSLFLPWVYIIIAAGIITYLHNYIYTVRVYSALMRSAITIDLYSLLSAFKPTF